MKVTKIYHPKKQKKAVQDILRVAAYCRVSTNSEDQLNSFEVQQTVYTDMIRKKPGWELVDIYADRGITGTNAKKRPEFQRMIRDCNDGKIDCIICKSLSRFARNTRDAIFYIRKLQKLGVRLIIEKEKIDTDDSYSEMTLTVLAAFAEEESRSLSENIKWAKRKKAQTGESPLPRLYGYRICGDNYEVVPEEAKIVHMIFDLYEHGVPSVQIADKLWEMRIPSPRGKEKWLPDVLCQMIKNEKYIGDCRTQKYYMGDISDSSRLHKNRGELPYVYIENHHEAIVSREQFNRCVEIMKLRHKSSPAKYPFGDRLRCPYCGHYLYYRSCNSNIRHFYCEGEDGEMACRKFAVHSDLVKNAVLDAYNHLDLKAVQERTDLEDPIADEEVEKLLKIKAEHPVFEKVDYWWLDDLVKEIRFGQHTAPCSEAINQGCEKDDRTISIIWKCGLTTTLPSGIKGNPKESAEVLLARIRKNS